MHGHSVTSLGVLLSESRRVQIPSLLLPTTMSPFTNPFSSPSSSSTTPPAVDHQPTKKELEEQARQERIAARHEQTLAWCSSPSSSSSSSPLSFPPSFRPSFFGRLLG